MDRIEGQLTYRPVAEKWYRTVLGGHIPLFDDHQMLVATAVSGEEGRFKFKDIAPGRYTLVIENESLHSLSVPIQIAAQAGESKTAKSTPVGPGLLLVMHEKTDRRKSVAIPITNGTLRAELLARVGNDQGIRHEMIQQGVEHPDKDVQARMTAIDADNLAWMRATIHQYGWPGPDLVGVDGTEAAFLLVQHSPYDFQKEMLPLIRTAYRAGRLPGQSYALLQDRVLVGEGKPQLYGTQGTPFSEWHQGEPVLYPIADEAHVDQRRASVGLSPLAEYVKGLKAMYFPQLKETQK